MNLHVNNLPTHEIVYRRIREMILFGEMTPGQAITIQGLVDELGVGMTPVREAIRRLTAEGALEFLGNRRICLPDMTLAQLEQIELVRDAVEPRLAFLAAENAKSDDVVRLAAIDTALNVAIAEGSVRGYLEYNSQFHELLYGLSGAGVLKSISAGLWLRIGPSLRVVCGRYGTENLPDMHREAIEALRAGDAKGVANAIAVDIRQGHDQIRRSLLD